MNKLFELGITEIDLRNMLELVPNIINMNENEINEKIEILKFIGCTDRHIRNIIISNPLYLDRINSDIIELISYLNTLGFSSLNILFDTNPYFLNYDVFEIKEYLKKQASIGKENDDIIDEIENNPYVIDYE